MANYKTILISLVVLFLIASLSVVQAAVMESESYKIQFDSVNVGGERQTSENYIIEDTIGEIATGKMESATYNLYAGYQQMNETYLSISDGADVSMTAMTMINASSTGSTSWTVITDNTAGYKLEIAASATSSLPCNHYLCSADTSENFTDYEEASGTTPEVWNTTNGAYEFGFSAYGNDVPNGTWGAGSSCGSGTTIPQDLNYRGFTSADEASGPATIEIASRTSRTEASGIATNFCLGAVQSAVYAPAGTYTATTTATATSL